MKVNDLALSSFLPLSASGLTQEQVDDQPDDAEEECEDAPGDRIHHAAPGVTVDPEPDDSTEKDSEEGKGAGRER